MEFQNAKDSTILLDSTTSKLNTDSGYQGMSDDEMDLDKVVTSAPAAVSLPSTQEIEGSMSPKLSLATNETAHDLDRQRTTEGSFHSALEDVGKKENSKEPLVLPEQMDIDIEPCIPAESPCSPHHSPLSNPAEATTVSEDAVDLGGIENESILDEIPSADALHSSSAESSPVKPLGRKSSLTFAALPAREPLTTKKSIGAQSSVASHFEQSRATMNRGSFLGRFTGGKSIGGSRQPDPVHAGSDDEMDIDKVEKFTQVREEPDGDNKITKLHNKSSTQRLHDKINMLGKSQPARPTKSIPAAAIVTQPNYPDLAAFGSEPATSIQVSTEAKVAGILNNANDDDDDWIKPPQKQIGEPKRPQLPKSTSVDVMEDIRGKRNISDQQFGIGNYDRDTVKESSPLRQNTNVDSHHNERSFSALVYSKSPKTDARNHLEMAVKPKATLEPALSHENPSKTSTIPVSTPSSKRNVDGPLSASKSKLQSIMKTARGLFTSSAGVSAQAKMETMSPHPVRKLGPAQVSSEENTNFRPIELSDNKILIDTNTNHRTQTAEPEQCHNNLTKPDEGRKTRSSTEKEVKRKENEAKERERVESELEQAAESERQRIVIQKRELRSNLTNVTIQVEVEETSYTKQSKPTRQSPRRAQKQQEPRKLVDHPGSQLKEAHDSQINHSIAPPSNPSQQQPCNIQRSKEPRRPVKPAKEVVPKPKPQPVAIRVGTLSQRIPLTNAALSSTLQDSLPLPPQKQPGPIKKPSTASLQTSASNNSLKSSISSAAPKPKALLAAERKKEQVSTADQTSNILLML